MDLGPVDAEEPLRIPIKRKALLSQALGVSNIPASDPPAGRRSFVRMGPIPPKGPGPRLGLLQKMIFKASCVWRGRFTCEATLPKPPVPTRVPGLPKIG